MASALNITRSASIEGAILGVLVLSQASTGNSMQLSGTKLRSGQRESALRECRKLKQIFSGISLHGQKASFQKISRIGKFYLRCGTMVSLRVCLIGQLYQALPSISL